MKNLFNRTLTAGLLALACVATCVSADAQGFVFDIFNGTRTDVLCEPTNIIGGAAGSGLTPGPLTNQWQDLHGFVGNATINLLATTNVGTSGGVMSCTVQVSMDTTNITTMTNVAIITAPTLSTNTNSFYGSATLQATNSFLVPGVNTTPTASSAGFATPYLADIGGGNGTQYTNGAVATITAGQASQIGFVIQNQPRYFRTIWNPSGTVTNWTVSAILTANPAHY